ncbi:MAG: hypothetical protein OXC42_01445 [Gammaproteobacteria bacterium]|nr:hypothetical protein [Gammaproteobacteria bacterium]
MQNNLERALNVWFRDGNNRLQKPVDTPVAGAGRKGIQTSPSLQ